MLQVYKPTPEEKRERIIVYGAPGVGKTRFALSLTPRFGNILYYAADYNSHYLDSIAAKKQERVTVIRTMGKDGPIADFSEFCLHDWASEEGTPLPDGTLFPRIGTIIVDTYTTVMQQAIMESANRGLAGVKPHFRVGEVNKGGQNIPTWDDYLGTEGLSRGLIKDLFEGQHNMHIIFVCHEDVKQVEGMPATGGPSHPGRKMVVDMPGSFSTVIRLIKEPVLIPGEEVARNRVIAITDHDGKFIAKTRTQDESGISPLGKVMLDPDPVNFWKQYDSIYAPQAQEVTNG